MFNISRIIRKKKKGLYNPNCISVIDKVDDIYQILSKKKDIYQMKTREAWFLTSKQKQMKFGYF